MTLCARDLAMHSHAGRFIDGSPADHAKLPRRPAIALLRDVSHGPSVSTWQRGVVQLEHNSPSAVARPAEERIRTGSGLSASFLTRQADDSEVRERPFRERPDALFRENLRCA